MWLSAPVDRREYSILLAAGCWLPMAAFSIWSMLVWKYPSVTLPNEIISLKGIFFCREIKLSDIEAVHWMLFPYVQIKFSTAVETGRIHSYYYTKAEESAKEWDTDFAHNPVPQND